MPDVMKIDTHQHFWRYRPDDFPWIGNGMGALKRDCLPADSIGAMQGTGVDAVVAVQARGVAAETDFLLALAEAHPVVAGVVGWADLRATDLDARLERWGAQPAFVGLRHILQDEPDVPAWLDDTGVSRGMASLQRARRVYEVLVYERQLPGVLAWCGRHDAHWLVLDHLGKPAIDEAAPSASWRRSLRALAAMPHVACKLSGLVTEADWRRPGGLTASHRQAIHVCFDQALAAFGPARLIYGSDWPVCELAATAAAVHDIARDWADDRLSVDEQQAFWSRNAVRIYGLNLPGGAVRPAA